MWLAYVALTWYWRLLDSIKTQLGSSLSRRIRSFLVPVTKKGNRTWVIKQASWGQAQRRWKTTHSASGYLWILRWGTSKRNLRVGWELLKVSFMQVTRLGQRGAEIMPKYHIPWLGNCSAWERRCIPRGVTTLWSLSSKGTQAQPLKCKKALMCKQQSQLTEDVYALTLESECFYSWFTILSGLSSLHYSVVFTKGLNVTALFQLRHFVYSWTKMLIKDQHPFPQKITVISRKSSKKLSPWDWL